MRSVRFSSSAFSVLALALFLFTAQTQAEEMEACTDCAVAQQEASAKAEAVSAAQNNIQTAKDQIENDLNNIMTGTESIDSEFEQMIYDLIQNSSCNTEMAYDDIIPETDGVKGHLYNQVFYCPDAASFEVLLQNGFQGNMTDWSTDFDPDNTTAWENISTQFVQLEHDANDYFVLLQEYEQALSDAQTCVEEMIQRQANGECTEEDIVHEEEDVPEDFEDPIDCPDCSEHVGNIDAFEAQLSNIEQQVEGKNQEIADLNDQLTENAQFATDLAELFANVHCDTEMAFDDIEVESGQAAGVLYGQVYYCQNETDVEALIAALDAFWETHTAPAEDESIINNINNLLAEIETLQDEYNSVLAEKVAEEELYQNCLNSLLTLQEQGMCLEEEAGDDDTTMGDDDDTTMGDDDDDSAPEVKTGETVTIPAQKRRSSSGGSSKSLNFCSYTIFSDITPAPNTMTATLQNISFTAKKTIKLSTMQLTVSGQTLELKATRNADGSYSVTAALPKAITKDGKYRVELFGQDGVSPVCSRQRLYTIEVNSQIGVVTIDNPNTPEDESAEVPQEGELFSEVSFSDITNHWAKEFILKLAQRGIINGYGDGKFGPDNNITRAEITKIALKAFAIGQSDVQTKPFSDVETKQWYAPFVARAKEFNIVSGYSDGTFKPNSSVTRGEGIKILINAAGIDVSSYASIESIFPDVRKTDFYNGYVNWATEKKIISGYTNGNFGPNDTLTRGQLAKIAMNILEFLNR